MAPVFSRHTHEISHVSTIISDGKNVDRQEKNSKKLSGRKSKQQTWDEMIDRGCISPPAAFKSSFFSRNSIQNGRSDSISPTPSLKSTNSNKSTESGKSGSFNSELGDSGVSSERGSPFLNEPESFLTNSIESESDDDISSNISTDSLHEGPIRPHEDLLKSCEENIYENHPFYQLKSPASRSISRNSTYSPKPQNTDNLNPFLRQICDKAILFAERRQISNSTENPTVLNLFRGISVKRSSLSSKLHHSSSFSSSSSLLSSSVYSSCTSLYDEDTFEDHSLPQRPMSVCEEESPNLDLVEVSDDFNVGSGFAGLHDIFSPPQKNTIRSQKGTVRGVRNRVRAGIATFTSDQRLLKIYKERERGHIIVYVTNLGIIRHTYERCQKIKKILWNLSIKFDERDVFMNREIQLQLLDRLNSKVVSLPHIFIEGQYLGGADLIEHLNENGELRRLLHQYRVPGMSTSPCGSCGGFNMLPCPVCNGSKKSLNRNHFTQEFVALKCCCCDEAGLIRCEECRG